MALLALPMRSRTKRRNGRRDGARGFRPGRHPDGPALLRSHSRPIRPRTGLQLFAAGIALAVAAASGLPSISHADPAADEVLHMGTFEQFAVRWLESLGRDAREVSEPISRATHPQGNELRVDFPEYILELRPTGQKGSPYVGVMRYVERIQSCPPGNQETCQIVKTGAVTELFRLENGKWVY